MVSKEIICIMCPLGCRMELKVNGEEVVEIAGNKCQKGEKHAHQELFFPGRVLTTTVRTTYPEAPLLPVKSDNLIPKGKLIECMHVIAKQVVSGPIQQGEVLIENILGLEVNIIASRSTSLNG
jgi:CxxC motif-containing protein